MNSSTKPEDRLDVVRKGLNSVAYTSDPGAIARLAQRDALMFVLHGSSHEPQVYEPHIVEDITQRRLDLFPHGEALLIKVELHPLSTGPATYFIHLVQRDRKNGFTYICMHGQRHDLIEGHVLIRMTGAKEIKLPGQTYHYLTHMNDVYFYTSASDDTVLLINGMQEYFVGKKTGSRDLALHWPTGEVKIRNVLPRR